MARAVQAVLSRSYAGRFHDLWPAFGMAVTPALEKAGRDVMRESFVDALETLDFDSEVVAGPIAFATDRRDAHRRHIHQIRPQLIS